MFYILGFLAIWLISIAITFAILIGITRLHSDITRRMLLEMFGISLVPLFNLVAAMFILAFHFSDVLESNSALDSVVIKRKERK